MKKYFFTAMIIIILIFAVSCQQYEQTDNSENLTDIPRDSENYSEKPDALPCLESGDSIYLPRPEGYVEAYGGCASDDCIHGGFGSSFHRVDIGLMDHVGREVFFEWQRNIDQMNRELNNPDCEMYFNNVVQLIRDFNISREEMEYVMKTTRMYYFNHDLDVIFSGNDELIRAFYTTPYSERENYSEFRLRAAELNLKSGLLDFSNDFGTRRNYTGDNIRLFNIVEFVRRYNVPRDEFEALIETRVSRQDRYPEVEYNVDLIFSNDPRLNFMIAQGVDPAIIDRMYQTNDGIFRYALIYELTVEAVNAGREITIAEVNRAIELDRMNIT